jgi:replicative DNA helicase
MRSKARRLKVENDVRLIVVDYLQLMRSPEHAENRVQEISDISRSLKGLARELEVPLIALSQLSRASEQRGGERRQRCRLDTERCDHHHQPQRLEGYHPHQPGRCCRQWRHLHSCGWSVRGGGE